MSSDDGPARAPGFINLGTGPNGKTTLVAPYTESMAVESMNKGLSEKAAQPSPGDDIDTPEPDNADSDYSPGEGPIRRFNDIFTQLGSVQLEALGLDGHEVASASSTLRDEMYRSEFPLVHSRFVKKCTGEECGAEYDYDVPFCIECARNKLKAEGAEEIPEEPEEYPKAVQAEFPVRNPDPAEEREAKKLTESVNREGQSLRGLMKLAEDDQSRLGVSVIVARKQYAIAAADTPGFSKGDVIFSKTEELIRGDPKRVVPVVDENGRIGRWRWACPVHRDNLILNDAHDNGHTRCTECNAELQEVWFVERERSSGAARYSGSNGVEKVYFEDEIITWARYFPRLHGLDGLSPIHHIWLKQTILHWMDVYGAAFYDPDSQSYPNKFMVVHTTNPDAWERQFEKAHEDARENPYSEQIMYNEYSTESSSTPEVQVIDLMSDRLIGQDESIRERYKRDIRNVYGVTNVFESELQDAGGLNNEGLQIEITDREVASAMRDTAAGPLDEIAKVLGIDDHKYEFIPPRETDTRELRDAIDVGQRAVEAGIGASLKDGDVVVEDGEFEAQEDAGGGMGGLGAMFGADFSEKADDGPCWDGYEMVGTKVDENGNEVPNCVPVDDKAEVPKSWVPYEGPLGGEGYQHPATGEVRYVDEKPSDEPSGGDGDRAEEDAEPGGAGKSDWVRVEPTFSTRFGDHWMNRITGERLYQDEAPETGAGAEFEPAPGEEKDHYSEPGVVPDKEPRKIRAWGTDLDEWHDRLEYDRDIGSDAKNALHHFTGWPTTKGSLPLWKAARNRYGRDTNFPPEEPSATNDGSFESAVIDSSSWAADDVEEYATAIQEQLAAHGVPERVTLWRFYAGENSTLPRTTVTEDVRESIHSEEGLEPRAVASWTDSPKAAYDFAEWLYGDPEAGVFVQRNFSREDILAHYAFDPSLKQTDQREVVVTSPKSRVIKADEDVSDQILEKYAREDDKTETVKENVPGFVVPYDYKLPPKADGVVTKASVDAGDKFFDSLNDETYEVVSVNGGVATVTDGGSEWDERLSLISDKINNGDWAEAGEGAETESMLEEVRKLDEAYKHIVWADETNKAAPFWEDDEDLPEFVKRVIRDVADRVVWGSIQSVRGARRDELAELFKDQLTQPQGWSLRSISDNLSERFGVSPENSDLVARTETAKILNEAREEGYKRAGALDERKFQWTGPLDGRTTDACRWMAEVTGWSDSNDKIAEYGRPSSVETVGEPVTYDELLDLQREATAMFFPGLSYRKHVIHPNERFTFTESFKMDHPGAAGDLELEFEHDASQAISGTFVIAP